MDAPNNYVCIYPAKYSNHHIKSVELVSLNTMETIIYYNYIAIYCFLTVLYTVIKITQFF